MKILRKWMFASAACLLSISITAQTTATTSDGRTVILNSNGTWEYARGSSNTKGREGTSMNKNNFNKSSNAKVQVKSKITNATVFMNPSIWTFKKDKKSGIPEYTFSLKNGGAYAMMLTEKAVLDLESLSVAALNNAKAAAPDARIVSKEMREVNGVKMICLRLDGTIDGTKFSYYGYYYTSKKGTVQLITYALSEVFYKYTSEMEELLNGLVIRS